MNKYLSATIRMLNRHGLNVTYNSITKSTYNPETGKALSNTNSFTIKSYPRQVVATQYNLPDLIGKELVEFYIANYVLNFVPKVGDEIIYKQKIYRVHKLEEHFAEGSLVLYKALSVKA